MYSTGKWWMWLSFLIFVGVVVLIDLFFLGRKKSHKVTTREAFGWMGVWVSCALLFNALLWWYLSQSQGVLVANQKALEFFSGYLIEQSLSTDNMFAFLMIFNYFAIPPEYQRRVLIYGVLSAIIMRLFIILGGTWVVSELNWILYVFGALLIFTGIKMLMPVKEEMTLDNNFLLIKLKKYLRVTNTVKSEHFFIQINKIWYATPLFLTLIVIEVSDLVFALDSIPAIFAVTDDAFIIFTSNIFAILGLRALYFLLANMAEQFHLLRYGIAIMLTFIGAKMLLAHWFKIPILWALVMLVSILGTSIILSIMFRPRR